MEQALYINALNLLNIPSYKLLSYLKPFQYNAKSLWHASHKELTKAHLPPEIIEKLLAPKKTIDIEQELNRLQNLGIKIILHPKLALNKVKTIYPELLSHIPLPPCALYIKGELKETLITIAVVGARKASSYGEEVTREITYNLGLAGVQIISGLAIGIDTFAHQSCLKAIGSTISIVANGLDIVYPYSNKKLVQEILESNGAIISEFPLGTKPLKQNFPQRNRIISGISQGTLVTEATLKSGSLITASYALQQNREVYAVPGSIYNKNSQGTNNLIKQGAKPVTQAPDILEDFNIASITEPASQKKPLLTSSTQEQIYSLLSSEPCPYDTIAEKLGLPPHEINAELTLMEIKGLIRNIGGSKYILKHI